MKKTFIIITLILIINSCEKERFQIENLNGNKITALGHAGMGIGNTYPMDSFESILQCLNLGMDGSEFDVQMTKDSVLVAYHDQFLSESTNLKGYINSLLWEELKTANFTQTPYLNYSIISLEQLFSHIKNIKQYTFTFDCKLYTNSDNLKSYYATYINAILNILKKHELSSDKICIESQSEMFLSMLKPLNQQYKLFIYPASFDEGVKTALKLNLSGITISTRSISGEQIKFAHKNNLLIAIWNTHSESDNIEAIKKNPDYIQTDKVVNLLKILN